MKKIFILGVSALLFVLSFGARAQSPTTFIVLHDSISANISANTGLTTILDNVTVPSSSSPVVIQWKVVYSNLPSDWVTFTGICDNFNCYPGATWSTAAVQTSGTYTATATSSTNSDFHVQVTPDSLTSMGCYKLKVKLWNQAVPSDSAITTYYICKLPLGIPVIRSASEPVIYPNPATSELNVVYDAASDVKNIAVYNLIGKVVSVYHVSGNSANLNLENVPSGIYFLRLMSSTGQVVATRKFTKQ